MIVNAGTFADNKMISNERGVAVGGSGNQAGNTGSGSSLKGFMSMK
jgi:hypothetical protein